MFVNIDTLTFFPSHSMLLYLLLYCKGPSCFYGCTDNLFFSTAAPRCEEDIRERFQQTFDRLLHYPHPLIVKAIGEQRFLEGTAMIVEGLQCRELNKHLFFKLLDIILLELFPELGEGEGTGEGLG